MRVAASSSLYMYMLPVAVFIAILSASGRDTSFVIYLLTEFGLIDCMLRARKKEEKGGQRKGVKNRLKKGGRGQGKLAEIVVAIEIEANAGPAWHNRSQSQAIRSNAMRYDCSCFFPLPPSPSANFFC